MGVEEEVVVVLEQVLLEVLVEVERIRLVVQGIIQVVVEILQQQIHRKEILVELETRRLLAVVVPVALDRMVRQTIATQQEMVDQDHLILIDMVHPILRHTLVAVAVVLMLVQTALVGLAGAVRVPLEPDLQTQVAVAVDNMELAAGAEVMVDPVLL